MQQSENEKIRFIQVSLISQTSNLMNIPKQNNRFHAKLCMNGETPKGREMKKNVTEQEEDVGGFWTTSQSNISKSER